MACMCARPHFMGVALSAYRHDWPAEFEQLAARLRSALGTIVLSVDHIGSTAVPGLAAKDVIDVQVIVGSLEGGASRALRLVSEAGFVQRDGDWNLRDHIPANWLGDPAAWNSSCSARLTKASAHRAFTCELLGVPTSA